MFQILQVTFPSSAGKEQAVKLSLPRASSLNENVDHSALLKLGATVSERVNRFDSKPGGEGGSSSVGFSKLQETRRIFEQRTLQVRRLCFAYLCVWFWFETIWLTDCHHLQEKQAATNRILLKKERASGFQDGRLDVVARFNGSTDALDRLDDAPAPVPAQAPTTVPAAAASVKPGEAISPTVSQLSAKFEKGEPQNNLYLPQRRPGPALAPKPKPPARAEAGGRKVWRINLKGYANFLPLFVICLLPEFHMIDTILSTVRAVTKKRWAELTHR